MPYKDKNKRTEASRRNAPIYREIYREANRCPRCSAPLMEEEEVYCITCLTHKQNPTKIMRGIL